MLGEILVLGLDSLLWGPSSGCCYLEWHVLLPSFFVLALLLEGTVGFGMKGDKQCKATVLCGFCGQGK